MFMLYGALLLAIIGLTFTRLVFRYYVKYGLLSTILLSAGLICNLYIIFKVRNIMFNWLNLSNKGTGASFSDLIHPLFLIPFLTRY